MVRPPFHGVSAVVHCESFAVPSVTANPAAIAQCSHCRPPAYCSSNCTALELSERRAGRSLGTGVGVALSGLAVNERNSSLGALARSSIGRS